MLYFDTQFDDKTQARFILWLLVCLFLPRMTGESAVIHNEHILHKSILQLVVFISIRSFIIHCSTFVVCSLKILNNYFHFSCAPQ